MASEPTSSKRSVINRLLGSAGPAVSKVKHVNPAAAKTSAVRGVTGVKDLAGLSFAYLKQETKEPLSGIGRLLAFGLSGAVFLSFGLVLFALSLLRGVQSAFAYVRADGDRGPLSGSLSWAPYVLSALGCFAAIAVIVVMLTRSKRATRRDGVAK